MKNSLVLNNFLKIEKELAYSKYVGNRLPKNVKEFEQTLLESS